MPKARRHHRRRHHGASKKNPITEAPQAYTTTSVKFVNRITNEAGPVSGVAVVTSDVPVIWQQCYQDTTASYPAGVVAPNSTVNASNRFLDLAKMYTEY